MNILTGIKTKLRKSWAWIIAPFVRFWTMHITLPREERIRRKVLKSNRLKSWVIQNAVNMIKTGQLDGAVMNRVKTINGNRRNRKHRKDRNKAISKKLLKK